MAREAARGIVSGAAGTGTTGAVECRCPNLDVLWGQEAEAYAAEHLQSDPQGELVCPDTGARWAVDEPGDDPELEQTALRKVAG